MSADASTAESSRKIDWWLDQYAIYHQNPTNKLIHYVCVPAIAVCVLGLCWSIPLPGHSSFGAIGPWLNVATLITIMATFFYLRLSPLLAVGMLVFTLSSLGLFYWMETSGKAPLIWQGSLVVFVVAWIFQFVGHKIEGAKPAFFDDLKFLLIGPLWILAHVLRKFGISY